MPAHIGKAAVDAVVPHGELGVPDAQEMQHGGVDFVDLGGVGVVEGNGGLAARFAPMAKFMTGFQDWQDSQERIVFVSALPGRPS